MTKPEAIKLLEAWQRQHEQCEKVYQLSKELMGSNPDCPLMATLWDTLQAYTRALAVLIGDSDGWLEWYQWDNGMGEKALKARASSWKRFRSIKNVRDLADLILDQ